MAENVSEAIIKTVDREGKKGREVTRDNCTIFDVYKVTKSIERCTKRMELMLLEDAGVSPSDVSFPFNLPLNTVEDLDSCENWIKEEANYQTLVSKKFFFVKAMGIFVA